MSFIVNWFNFLLHIDKAIGNLILVYGAWVYFILFLIVFVETGLVFIPFLPGDSLIFVAGAFAAGGLLNIFVLFFVLVIAAILGDTVNYWIGNFFGLGISRWEIVGQENLEKAQRFYEKFGGKAIVFARFVPIVRSIVPFVAGVGKMKYRKFLFYNVIGALAWVVLLLTAGYYFGTIPFVQNNLTIIVLLIVFISILPPIAEWVRRKIVRGRVALRV